MTIITPYPDTSAWPVEWQGCHLTGRFVDTLGKPVVGSVAFRPSPAALLAAQAKIIVIAATRTIVLDANGAFDLFLPATDDPGINPVLWTYSVEEMFPGGRAYSIPAPMNTTVDLSGVAPVPSANGVASVVGPRGPAGEGMSDAELAVALSVGAAQAYQSSIYALKSDGGTAGLTTHVRSPTPHPAYDDTPDLSLLFQNGLI